MPEILFLLALLSIVLLAAIIIVWPRRSPQTVAVVFTIDSEKFVSAMAQAAAALSKVGVAASVSSEAIQEAAAAFTAAAKAEADVQTAERAERSRAEPGTQFDSFSEPARTRARADADEWNDDYPIGTPVYYWLWLREASSSGTSVTTAAARVAGGRAVVDIKGVGGGIALTHVEPVTRNPEGHAA